MSRKYWYYFILLWTGWLIGGTSQTTQAADSQQTVTFMILPKIPQANIGGSKLGYFNLKVKPNQQQTLQIKVINPTAQKITIKTAVNNAQTTSQGQTTYLIPPTSQQTRLIKQPLSQLIVGPETIRLAPGESKWVRFKLTMSQQPLVGQSVGALVLSSTATTAGSFKNRYVYAVGVTLNGQPLKKQSMNRLQLPNVKVGLVQHKPALRFAIDNPDPTFLKKGYLRIQLKHQRFGFYGYSLNLKKMQIAPQSQFWANSMLGGRRLVAGTYRMTMTFKSQQYQQTVHKTVRISHNQARYINQHNAAYQKRLRRWLIGGGLSVILVIGAGIYYRRYVRSARKNDEKTSD